MQDFLLPNGPWVRFIEAKWSEHEIIVYKNPDRLLATFVLDNKGGELSGFLIFLRKILVSRGDISKFLSIQKMEINFLQKLSRGNSFNYLVISATPGYVVPDEEKVISEVRRQISELENFSKLVSLGISNVGGEVRDLKEESDEVADLFFGDPMLFYSITTLPKPVEKLIKHSIGIDSNGIDAEINIKSLSSVSIVGGSLYDRLHAVHVLCEGALLNNISCLIFDSSGSFYGFNAPQTDVSRYQEFNMCTPITFIFREFAFGKGLFIDLAFVDAELFLQAFELNSDVSIPLRAVFEKKCSGLEDLVSELNNLKDSREMSRYLINKAIRVIRVIEKANPPVFAKNINSELLMPWHDALGRVVHVNVEGQPEHLVKLLVHSLLKSIKVEKSDSLGLLVVLDSPAGELHKSISNELASVKNIGFIVHAESELDLPSFKPSLKLDLIGSEVVVNEFGERQKRIRLRPGFSKCTEFK